MSSSSIEVNEATIVSSPSPSHPTSSDDYDLEILLRSTDGFLMNEKDSLSIWKKKSR